MESLSAGVLAAPPTRQTIGDYLGLCLLIDFDDEPATVSRDEVDAFCNQPGYSGGGNHASVVDYYSDNSGGKRRCISTCQPLTYMRMILIRMVS